MVNKTSWYEKKESINNTYELTKEEILKVESHIKNNHNSVSIDFYNYWIEKLNNLINSRLVTEKENYGDYKDPYISLYKAMVIMKENWALYIDELDKLDKSYKSFNNYELIKREDFNFYELSDEEIRKWILYIENNSDSLMSHFFNKWMEWINEEIKLIKDKKLEKDELYLLSLKIISTILTNWFKDINEFEKFVLQDKLLERQKYKDLEVTQIKEQSEIRQKEDLNEALILSEKIKNGKI